LWWAFSYPLAGWMGSHFPEYNFFYAGLISAVLLIVVHLALNHKQGATVNSGLWHEHEHMHDEQHQHNDSVEVVITQPHRHLHFHAVTQEGLSHYLT